jgi:hypothetical protein
VRISRLGVAIALAGALLLLLYGLSALSTTYLVAPFVPRTPFLGQLADGAIQADVFVGDDALNLRRPETYLLGGRLGELQALDAILVGQILASLAALAAISGALVIATGSRFARWAFFAAMASLSIFWSIRISGGWDEYFINLKHAFNLANHFKFSANFQSNLEATVDFAPFALAALISRVFALNVADVAIGVSLAGNALCIIASYSFARRLSSGSEAAGVVAGAVVGLFPAIINVGGTGFMSGLFAGLVILAAYLLIGLRGRWSARAIFLLGLLTLFRTEAVLLAVLLVAALGARFWFQTSAFTPRPALAKRAWRIIGLRAAFAISPFVAASLVRLAVFGEPVPVPVVFKSGGLDMGYIRNGIEYFITCIQTFRIDVLFAIAGLPIMLFLLKKGSRPTLFFGCVLAFTLAYITGGGDWFPAPWARYVAPLLLTTTVIAVCTAYAASRDLSAQWRLPGFLAIVVVGIGVLFGTGGASNAYRDMWNDWPKTLNRWERVDNLSAYGDFLGKTLPANAVIASPEDASLMYHAERDMVDLLGIANRQIAHSPLDPLGPGDLMHRRRNVDVVKTARPDVIALFEMSFPVSADFNRHDPEVVRSFVQAFPLSQYQLDTSFYRVGSYGYLRSLGYHPVAVAIPGMVFFYWVNDKTYAAHVAAMEKLGLRHTAKIPLTYHYSSSYTDRFYGGLPYVGLVIYDKSPPGAPAEPFNIAKADPAWAAEGLPKAFVEAPPPGLGVPYSSWNGADANVGRLTTASYQIDAVAQRLVVPVMQGPDSAGQSIIVRDARTGNQLAQRVISAPEPHKWYWLAFQLQGLNVDQVTVEAVDEGAGWGQWSAVGPPRVISAAALPQPPAPKKAP